MNNLFSQSFETSLEQGQSVLKKAGDTVVKQVVNTTQVAATQLTGQQHSSPHKSEMKMPVEHSPVSANDVVRDFYAPSKGNEILQEMKPEHKQAMVSQQQVTDNENLQLTRQKIQEHFQQHTTMYYKPTFEEHPKIEAQKEEYEKQQEDEENKMKFLDKEEKKKEDIALRRAQTSAETKHGAVG